MSKTVLSEIASSSSAAEFSACLQQIRKNGMRSNSVFPLADIIKKLECGDAWCAADEQAAIVIIPDNENIFRLYYFLSDSRDAGRIKGMLPPVDGKIVCDVIGREPKIYEQTKLLTDAGFILYATFQRMMCNTLTLPPSSIKHTVEPAKIEDAAEILELTRQEFDPLTARMHNMEQLQNIISANEVFVVRKEGRIAGFTIFDSAGKKVALLDHVIVRPEYRREGIGKSILAYKWNYANTSQYYVLWINEKCKGPIRYHEENGFQKDGMLDCIMVPE